MIVSAQSVARRARACARGVAAVGVVALMCVGAPRAVAQVSAGLPGGGGYMTLVPVPDTLPLPAGLGDGEPAYPVRGLEMSLIYGRDLRIFPLADLLAAAHRDRFTHVILQIDNVAEFASLREMTTDNTLFNFRWLHQLVQATRAAGLEPVLGVDLLGRQDVLFGPSHPEALLNRTTLDIRTPAAQRLVKLLLTDLVDSLGVKTILIGHEAARFDSLSPAAAQDLYTRSVIFAHDVLAAKGARTAIYGGLLLSPRETRGLSTSLGARFDTPAVRGALPRDLFVLDRHDAPRDSVLASIDSLRAAGFTVWSTTGLDRVSRAAAARQARGRGAEGIVLATADYIFRRGGPLGAYREMRHAATLFWNPALALLADPGPVARPPQPAPQPAPQPKTRRKTK